jgi:signal transduction histidine kinase
MTGHLTPNIDKQKPSRMWAIAASVGVLVAVVSATLAYGTQRAADRPVGEGELFSADGTAARRLFADLMIQGQPADEALRHLRNGIAVEAASIVDSDALITTSTSRTLVGREVTNSILRFALSAQRFGAVATKIDADIAIDGVTEWDEGDVLYVVLQPLDDGDALLLHYDIAELLGRRIRARGIRSTTLMLLGVAGLFLALATLALIGRAHTVRRIREVALEAGLLRKHAGELETKNAELDAARRKAEEALELAEEKNRIRAEFVLMINHELRTPLTAVVTGADLLRADNGLTDDDRRTLLESMVADGRRLEEMIGQMLFVARIENRGLDFHTEDTTVAGLWERISSSNPRLRNGPDAMPTHILDAEVLTDANTLSRLIGSLADNSFTHGASVVGVRCLDSLSFHPMIEVGSRSRDAVYFVVEDNGPGIEPAFLPRIFEKFEKSGFSPGTGLGLYLAKLMVEALGASLSVSTSSQGTSMAVGVPRVAVMDLADVR